jgi:DNA-binding NtrC family response regulator
MTAYYDTDLVVQAIKAGATDFIAKPWENQKLLATIFAALKLKSSRNEADNLRAQVQSLTHADKPEIIGTSDAMCGIMDALNKYSETDANILLLGENGTGKDLIAKEICRRSLRAAKPFVAIDLGSIPETLFESELFGYDKGAFTDARTEKAGRIEIASGGTLFLNEIGNLSLPMQAKLLTVIEKKEISRLGSTRVKPVNVRLISATNLDIYDAVAKGAFRQDLLYRINTLEIRIPPLRERNDDIILLAEHFLHIYNARYRKSIKRISTELKKKLLAYNFPGNVRELQNIIERAVIMSVENTLNDCALSLPAKCRSDKFDNLNLAVIEREAIEKALKRSDGNISSAAEMLGISRYTLYRKINNQTDL